MAPMQARRTGRGQNGLLHRGLDAGLHLRIVLAGADHLLACALTGAMDHLATLLALRTGLTCARSLGPQRLTLSCLTLGCPLALCGAKGAFLRCGGTGGRVPVGTGVGILGGHALTPPALLILLAPSYISAQNSSSTDPLPGS
jgi:hypothetical protein